MEFLIFAFMGSLAAYALYLTFRGRSSPITDPTLGLLNIGGNSFAQLMEEDRACLSPLFAKVEVGSGLQIPKCAVLFVYTDITADGQIGLGQGLTIRHLAERAAASIVVLAAPNSWEHIAQALKQDGPKRANLVCTMDRKGAIFSAFFRKLFELMRRGSSMPMAWNSLAPQIPSRIDPHTNVPETIAILEAGQVKFSWTNPQ
jgi:hypothetical protein